MFVTRWNGIEIARSAQAILVENTLYVPPEAIAQGALRAGRGSSECYWKGGSASYFDVVAGGAINEGAAWTYKKTAAVAKPIEGWIGFWKGVRTAWEGDGDGSPQVLDHKMPAVADAIGAQSVEWRPKLQIAGFPEEFTGYRIASPHALVEVFAESGNDARNALVEEARARAQAVARFSDLNPVEKTAYIAVWGSARPSPRALAALKAGHCVVDLVEPPELIGS